MKRTTVTRILLVGVLAGLCGSAAAEPRSASRPGDDTRAWLQLQASGAAATSSPQTMPGEVADKVYERYLNSFERPVPEQFERERFISAGAGN